MEGCVCMPADHDVRPKRLGPATIQSKSSWSSGLCSVNTQQSGAVGVAGRQGSSRTRVKKNTVNLRSPQSFPPPPPLASPTNQCKCRRRPGPQLAFQRSRTTSRALNKCRCDRRETRRGRLSAPHRPPRAGQCTPPRASAERAGCLRRPREVGSGGTGCAPRNRGG